MAIIQNIPQAMIAEHVGWHTRPGNPAGGGRAVNPWPPTGGGPAPGSGEEFLVWHSGYLARFHQWINSLPANQRPAAIAPWSAIPSGLKMGMVGWNARLADQERLLQNMANFGTLDELGRFLEWSLHSFLHSAASAMHSEPILLSFESPRSTYFWQLHGLIENWRQQWVDEDGRSDDDGPPTSSFVNIPSDGTPVNASIGGPGEVDRFAFAIPQTGQFAIETQGPTDVVMYLAGPDDPQRLVAVNDDGGNGGNARLAGTLPTASYFVYIVHYSAGGTGPYSISVKPL